MALDGGVVNSGLGRASTRESESPRAEDLLETAETVGAAFRLRREARGLSLDQLSLATRIRPQYIAAIEGMRLDELPSGPFAVGYVRACASALGLDPEHAAARYRREAPGRDQVRAAPVGVDPDSDPHFRMLVALGLVVVCAIVAWNIAQRVTSHGGARRPTQAAVVAGPPVSSKTPMGPVALGAPLPPPPESTTPEPYVTPGLETTPAGVSSAPVQASPIRPVGTPFETRGPIYGAPPAAALVILQADKPASVVVRGTDGTVYFARQLETGEAYGAPELAGLTVEVSNPAVVSVFVNRALRGPLPATTASLSSLTTAAQP
jgi:cytoskeleton protein RodZ